MSKWFVKAYKDTSRTQCEVSVVYTPDDWDIKDAVEEWGELNAECYARVLSIERLDPTVYDKNV